MTKTMIALSRRMLLAASALAVIGIASFALWAGTAGTQVAHAQGLIAPGNQQARNAGPPGEVIVTWNGVAGASKYRVGWLSDTDFVRAGWPAALERFTFVDISTANTQYRVTRLTPGEEYWFIVASVDAGNRMYWPQSWVQKFAVTAAPTPTPCPTSHGPGVPTGGGGEMCPITGLPIGDGYLEIGDTSEWGEYSIRLDRATIPATVDFGNGRRDAPAGRKWIYLELTAQNDRNYSVFFGPGTEYVLDTDTGNGFAWQSSYELEANRGDTITLVHDIPATATVAVLAVQADTGYTNSTYNQPDLFRIPIPQ